jgi:hypothetical protein
VDSGPALTLRCETPAEVQAPVLLRVDTTCHWRCAAVATIGQDVHFGPADW